MLSNIFSVLSFLLCIFGITNSCTSANNNNNNNNECGMGNNNNNDNDYDSKEEELSRMESSSLSSFESEFAEYRRYCPNNIETIIPAPMMDVNCQCSQYRPGSLTLDKNLHDITLDDVIDIKKIVNKYGVIVLSNVTIDNDNDLLRFTSLFGEMIPLPSVFTKQEHDSEYIGIITNIFENGTVDTNDKTAGYWHNDGDFWQNNYLYNFLFSKIVPNKNGETGFLDLREAFKHIACEYRDFFDQLSNQQVIVKSSEIPDFRHTEMDLPHAYHHILSKHVVTDESIVYYGHRNAQIRGLNDTESQDILFNLESIISNVDYYKYLHRWSPNEMLIWDNTLVMHRAMGNVGTQARLLLRTQAKIDIFDSQI